MNYDKYKPAHQEASVVRNYNQQVRSVQRPEMNSQQRNMSRTDTNPQQYAEALVREREIHDLKMTSLLNKMQLQYTNRLKEQEQAYLERVGQLESKIKQMNSSQINYHQGSYPMNLIPQAYPMNPIQGTLTPGPCPGGCGPR